MVLHEVRQLFPAGVIPSVLAVLAVRRAEVAAGWCRPLERRNRQRHPHPVAVRRGHLHSLPTCMPSLQALPVVRDACARRWPQGCVPAQIGSLRRFQIRARATTIVSVRCRPLCRLFGELPSATWSARLRFLPVHPVRCQPCATRSRTIARVHGRRPHRTRKE